MSIAPKLGKNVGRDVVLCETTYRMVSNRTTDLLLESSVPFSKVWRRVPILKRRDYNGASKVCVISTNRTQYGRARQVLTNLEYRDQKKLLLNVL